MTWLSAMCCIMNAVPTTVAETNSTGSSCEKKGSSMPATTTAPATATGRKAPTRSTSRPAGTARIIGITAYSAISTPMVMGVAPPLMAESETVMRLPTKPMWLSTVSRMK
jgi:hypothetical protein